METTNMELGPRVGGIKQVTLGSLRYGDYVRTTTTVKHATAHDQRVGGIKQNHWQRV